jgi:hypothetical protein
MYCGFAALLQVLEEQAKLGDLVRNSAFAGYTIGFVVAAYTLLLTLAKYKKLVKKLKMNDIIRFLKVGLSPHSAIKHC